MRVLAMVIQAMNLIVLVWVVVVIRSLVIAIVAITS